MKIERCNGLDVDGGEVSGHRHRLKLPVEADELRPEVLLPGGENARNLIRGVHLDEEIQSLVLEHHDAVGKGRKSKSKREGRCGAPEEETFLHREYFQASQKRRKRYPLFQIGMARRTMPPLMFGKASRQRLKYGRERS